MRTTPDLESLRASIALRGKAKELGKALCDNRVTARERFDIADAALYQAQVLRQTLLTASHAEAIEQVNRAFDLHMAEKAL